MSVAHNADSLTLSCASRCQAVTRSHNITDGEYALWHFMLSLNLPTVATAVPVLLAAPTFVCTCRTGMPWWSGWSAKCYLDSLSRVLKP